MFFWTENFERMESVCVLGRISQKTAEKQSEKHNQFKLDGFLYRI